MKLQSAVQKIRIKLRTNGLNKEFKIIFQFFWNNCLAYVLMFVQNFLINKYMPVTDLGQFSYNQSLLILFASIYSMEAYSSYLRFTGFVSDKSLLKVIQNILVIASVLFCTTVLIFFDSWFYIFFLGYMWVRERLYFFRAKLDIGTYGKIKIFQYLISVAFLAALIVSGQLTYQSMLLCMGLSYLIVSIIYIFNRKARAAVNVKNTANLEPIRPIKIFKYAIPLAFNAIVTWLLSAADQFLIDTYMDTMTLTYYSVALRNVNIIRLCVGSVMEYWPRFYFENMEKKNYKSIKTMKIIFMGGTVFLCIGSIIFNKFVYIAMGAGQYTHVSWMFSLLVISVAFNILGSINITYQSFVENNTVNFACLAVLGGLKFITNWLLVRTYGVDELLYSTVICYFVYFMGSIYFGSYQEKRYKEVNFRREQ